MPVLCWFLPFSLFTVVPLTTGTHPLSSLKPLWKCLRKHTHKCVSRGISSLVMVTVKIIIIAVIVFYFLILNLCLISVSVSTTSHLLETSSSWSSRQPSPKQQVIQRNHLSVIFLSVFCPSVLVCRLLCGL